MSEPKPYLLREAADAIESHEAHHHGCVYSANDMCWFFRGWWESAVKSAPDYPGNGYTNDDRATFMRLCAKKAG
jgi:hypothetical protein